MPFLHQFRRAFACLGRLLGYGNPPDIEVLACVIGGKGIVGAIYLIEVVVGTADIGSVVVVKGIYAAVACRKSCLSTGIFDND